MKPNLKKIMIDGFSGEGAQIFYRKKAADGFWISEKFFIEKYFTQRHTRVLDIGCGAGRTSLPLAQMGFQVTGVDIAPPMIAAAKQIVAEVKQITGGAKQIVPEKGIEIEYEIQYEIGDATALQFPDATFEYALFSNQGWSQIPGWAERRKALQEVHRVLKPGGLFLFTAHSRDLWHEFPFWIVQWVRMYVLKPFGFEIMEEEYGDRFFDKEPSDSEVTYEGLQYIHVPTIGKVQEEICNAGFTLVETNGTLQISEKDVRTHPPVVYVCRK